MRCSILHVLHIIFIFGYIQTLSLFTCRSTRQQDGKFGIRRHIRKAPRTINLFYCFADNRRCFGSTIVFRAHALLIEMSRIDKGCRIMLELIAEGTGRIYYA